MSSIATEFVSSINLLKSYSYQLSFIFLTSVKSLKVCDNAYLLCS